VLEGGFGYEDRGRSGLIASFDPIMDEIKKLANQGTIVMGICNGAQALVESGLIPGVKNDDLAMALAKNKRVKDGEVMGTGFYSTWINLKSVTPEGRSPFNYSLREGKVISLPIAHAEGRFTTDNKKVEKELFNNKQVLFQYCNADGDVIDEYPINPNGSNQNIAAVCNPAGNVLAIMPHPERGLKAPGKSIFDSVFDYLNDKKKKKLNIKIEKELPITIKKPTVEKYKPARNTIDIYIELLITDNEEFTLQHTFDALNLAPVKLKKYRFVSISAKRKIDDKTVLKMIKNDYFVNTQKEICYIEQKDGWKAVDKTHSFKKLDRDVLSSPALRVNYRENSVGMALFNTFHNKFKNLGISSVSTGVVWEFQNREDSKKKLTKKQLSDLVTHRLFWNPHSQEAKLIE